MRYGRAWAWCAAGGAGRLTRLHCPLRVGSHRRERLGELFPGAELEELRARLGRGDVPRRHVEARGRDFVVLAGRAVGGGVPTPFRRSGFSRFRRAAETPFNLVYPQVADLAARFRVLRYDCRGSGASGPFDPAIGYTHAGDLLALLDHLAIELLARAGRACRSAAAMQAALACLERVAWPCPARRGAGRRSVGPCIRLGAGGGAAGPRAGYGPAGLAGPPAVRRRPPAARPGQLARRYGLRLPGPALDRSRPASANGPRPIDALGRMQSMPVLVTVGERDVPGFREMAAVLARRIPCAQYHVVRRRPHHDMEQPAVVNALLARFLTSHHRPGGAGPPARGNPGRRPCGRHRAAAPTKLPSRLPCHGTEVPRLRIIPDPGPPGRLVTSTLVM